MSETQQRTATGGAAGAAGLTGGFLYGKHEESKQQAYQQGVEEGRKSR
jgi:hypothetical protein